MQTERDVEQAPVEGLQERDAEVVGEREDGADQGAGLGQDLLRVRAACARRTGDGRDSSPGGSPPLARRAP
ncbi:hypothetical protein, partial [Streptomyces sp. NPDC050600]|uniref:hypothetical protein n=1 Tax=Streptomyces sp. NPDC050600 TaxID=3157213 RepID=UPI00342EAC8C